MTAPLIVRRLIAASAETLFAAWTQPDQLMRWWGPRGVRCCAAEVDLRVGGRYRIGNEFDDGEVLWISGVFERIAPPRELVYSWCLEGGPAGTERVSVRFEPAARAGACEVIVTHERVADASLRAQHERGWIECLQELNGLFDPAR